MSVKIFLFSFLILNFERIKGKSYEYYNCINPNKQVNNPSECTSIQIPDSEGYKCCSMKIVFKGEHSYNCFALESEYTKSKKILDEYITNISLASYFGTKGGQIEIECGQDMISTENYEKYSDEFKNCYKGNLKGVENETECLNNNIPEREVSKCCFVETSQIINGTIINDKRCYIIKDEYFSKNKNLNDYILDQTKETNLDKLSNINITIRSKNNDTFYFIGKSYDKETSSPSSEISSNNETNNTEIIIPSSEDILNNETNNTEIIIPSSEDILNNDSQIDSLLLTEDISMNDSQTDSLPLTEDISNNDNQTDSLSEKKIVQNSQKSGLSTGVIITIAILCSLLLIGIVSIVFYLRIKGSKSNRNDIKYEDSVKTMPT